jgi:acyl carrier protein
MTRDDLIQEIAGILKILTSELTADSRIGLTPGWDSMAHVDIMMLLEERCGIEISEDLLEHYTVLGNILELVEKCDEWI